MTTKDIQLTKVKHDTNGNPRYVVHFLQMLTDEEYTAEPNSLNKVSNLYNLALSKAKKIGGRKFHNKQYGGGIVFTGYESELKGYILKVRNGEPLH